MPQPSGPAAKFRMIFQVQSVSGTGQQPSALARDSHMAMTPECLTGAATGHWLPPS